MAYSASRQPTAQIYWDVKNLDAGKLMSRYRQANRNRKALYHVAAEVSTDDEFKAWVQAGRPCSASASSTPAGPIQNDEQNTVVSHPPLTPEASLPYCFPYYEPRPLSQDEPLAKLRETMDVDGGSLPPPPQTPEVDGGSPAASCSGDSEELEHESTHDSVGDDSEKLEAARFNLYAHPETMERGRAVAEKVLKSAPGCYTCRGLTVNKHSGFRHLSGSEALRYNGPKKLRDDDKFLPCGCPVDLALFELWLAKLSATNDALLSEHAVPDRRTFQTQPAILQWMSAAMTKTSGLTVDDLLKPEDERRKLTALWAVRSLVSESENSAAFKDDIRRLIDG